jgi:hypothetical protein
MTLVARRRLGSGGCDGRRCRRGRSSGDHRCRGAIGLRGGLRGGAGRRRRHVCHLLTCRANGRDDRVDGHGLAFLDRDGRQHAGSRRRDFRIDLVGRDLKQRLVAIDGVADLLDPSDDRALGNRFAHLRHDNWCRHSET